MRIAELEGVLLDAAVAKACGFEVGKHQLASYEAGPNPVWCFWSDPKCKYKVMSYSSDWRQGGPIIQEDQIFLDPPHDVHMSNYGPDGKPHGIWKTFESWHAVVSARTRTIPNPHDPALPRTVGRGEGPTALIAAMRAKVASHFGSEIDL